MKIRLEHREVMRAKIEQVLADNPDIVTRYETGKFYKSDRVKDLQERFCFDLFHAAGLTRFACENIYVYATDNHISTALRSMCPVVTKRY